MGDFVERYVPLREGAPGGVAAPVHGGVGGGGMGDGRVGLLFGGGGLERHRKGMGGRRRDGKV